MSTDSTSRKTIDRTDSSTQTPPILRDQMAELLAEIDGLPILVRVLVKTGQREGNPATAILSRKMPICIRCCRAHLSIEWADRSCEVMIPRNSHSRSLN